MSTSKPHAESHFEITPADLPLHCPMDDSGLWSSHPRVFLPIAEDGYAKCPYCGAEYRLKDDGSHTSHGH